MCCLVASVRHVVARHICADSLYLRGMCRLVTSARHVLAHRICKTCADNTHTCVMSTRRHSDVGYIEAPVCPWSVGHLHVCDTRELGIARPHQLSLSSDLTPGSTVCTVSPICTTFVCSGYRGINMSVVCGASTYILAASTRRVCVNDICLASACRIYKTCVGSSHLQDMCLLTTSARHVLTRLICSRYTCSSRLQDMC